MPARAVAWGVKVQASASMACCCELSVPMELIAEFCCMLQGLIILLRAPDHPIPAQRCAFSPLAQQGAFVRQLANLVLHGPGKHIEKLWQFIQARRAQKTSDPSDSRVTFQFMVCFPLCAKFWILS